MSPPNAAPAASLVSAPPLGAGAVVQPIAPSGAFDPQALAASVALLQQWGLDVRPLPPCCPPPAAPYLAHDDAQRIEALQQALIDPQVDVVWAVRGGFGAARLVPQIGALVAALRRRPVWLVGFSDITVLHQVWAQAGVASMHAANLNGLASWGAQARQQLACLLGLGPGAPQPLHGRPCQLAPPPCRAPLCGGNLSVLASLVGTPLMPSLAGRILLLEDLNEPPYRLDRAATQLRLAGVLDGLLAVALGQITDAAAAARPGWEAACEAAVLHGLSSPQLPVLAGLPVGHRATSWPVALGLPTYLDLTAGVLGASVALA